MNGLTVVGLRLMDSVFGLLLLTTEPRTGGRATAGEDYVAVGIENLDCRGRCKLIAVYSEFQGNLTCL